MSASLHTSGRSRVREWQIVTVACWASRSSAACLPTMVERPITTAPRPCRGACSRVRIYRGRRGRRRGKGTRHTRGEHAKRLRIGSIDILADRDGRTDDGQIQTVRKRGLADDPVHTRVSRQLGKPPGDLGPVSSRGQPVNLAVDTPPGGGCVDGPQIPGGPLVVGGDDRGQGRRYPPLAQESSQLGGPLRYGSGDGLAVDDAAHPGISCRTGKRLSVVCTLRAWLVMRRHPHRPPGGKPLPGRE